MTKARRARTTVVVAIALVAAGAVGTGALSSAGAAAGPNNSVLNGVHCLSPTNCYAVGQSTIASPRRDKTLVEHWDGKTWSIVPSPNPVGATSITLSSVACSSATNCFAVGRQAVLTPYKGRTLIERWNGQTWSIAANPDPSPSSSSDPWLRGISCTSKSSCFAVGVERILKGGNYVDSKALVERWNGAKWSIVPTPRLSGTRGYDLDAVSCTSAQACFAVGDYSARENEPGSIGQSTLTERWNGKTWSVVTSPTPGIGEGAGLLSVSCTSAPRCVAAGQYLIGGPGRPATLAERWNGTSWTITTGKLAPNRSYNAFNGVSCTSTSNCTATGFYSRPNPAVLDTLIERWNGKAWSIVPSAGVQGSFNILNGVSCPSATNCMSVGYSFGPTPNQTLAERWNGKVWSIVASPNP